MLPHSLQKPKWTILLENRHVAVPGGQLVHDLAVREDEEAVADGEDLLQLGGR